MIKIIRKDGSERLVEIIKDKATNKWRYIDLTSNHICVNSWDSYNEAIKSIYDEPFIKEWSYVVEKDKKEKYNWSGLFHYIGVLLRSLFKIG